LTSSDALLLVAACALIDDTRRVLVARRPKGKKLEGLWEFPGGKIEPGESPEDTLVRELKEELAVAIDRSTLAPLTFASHRYPEFHLLMPLFVCSHWRGVLTPLENQAIAWVSVTDLLTPAYPMPPADGPLIPALRDFLG